MINFEKKHLILVKLADGAFHSGETLGEQLGISRAAISKHIKQLQDYGIEIFSVSGKGYCLAQPLNLLSSSAIADYCKAQDSDLPIEVHHVIDSTNDHLLRRIRAGEKLADGTTVVAECQTAGRGRRGRKWVSPFGSHIYFSFVWQLDGIGQAMGLSIAVGLALRYVLQPVLSAELKVKWPNDLLVENHKIAGILVELEGQADGPCSVVIGIGINVNMPEKEAGAIDQPWTDVVTHSAVETVDRNELIANLMVELKHQMEKFTVDGLAPLIPSWNLHDHYYNQPVDLIMGNHVMSGIGRGIDNQGGIVLLDPANKTTKSYYGGEISLRGSA